MSYQHNTLYMAIFCIVVTSWVSQERFLLNPCCLSVRMLYWSKWLIMLLWMMCSSTLQTIDVYPSMKDIVINTKGVFKLLKDLNPHKATGPDCINIPSFILECCGRTGTNFNATIPVLTSRRRNTIWSGLSSELLLPVGFHRNACFWTHVVYRSGCCTGQSDS
jgi:hypothetical protein